MIIQNNEKIPLNTNLPKIGIKIINKAYYFKGLFKKLFNTNFYIYVFFFLSYLLYFFSLEKCTEGMDECPRNIEWIKSKIKEVIFSCLIMLILIELIIYKKISRLHIIHIILFFILFYSYSHGLDFENHGYFNFKGYFILLIILFIIFLPINVLIYLIQKNKNKKKLIIFIYTIILIFILILINILYNKYTTDCSDWPKGLNNTFLEYNSTKYGCQIIFPSRCPYPVFKNILDYTKFVGKECKKFGIDAKQKILKLSNSPNDSVNHIGYPLTNKDPICNLDFIDTENIIEKFFLKNLVDMENKGVLNKFYKDKIPEVEVDFSKSIYGEMNINLNFNKTLSEERIILEKKTTPYSNNIIILYIDSVSRVNSLRQLKKTLKFFEQFMFQISIIFIAYSL